MHLVGLEHTISPSTLLLQWEEEDPFKLELTGVDLILLVDSKNSMLNHVIVH